MFCEVKKKGNKGFPTRSRLIRADDEADGETLGRLLLRLQRRLLESSARKAGTLGGNNVVCSPSFTWTVRNGQRSRREVTWSSARSRTEWVSAGRKTLSARACIGFQTAPLSQGEEPLGTLLPRDAPSSLRSRFFYACVCFWPFRLVACFCLERGEEAVRRASSKWVDTQTANQPNTAAAATSFASGDRRDTANTAIFRVAPVGQVPQARGRIGAARDETRKGRVRKDKNLFPRQNQIEWADLGCRRLATRTARDITATKKRSQTKKRCRSRARKENEEGKHFFSKPTVVPIGIPDDREGRRRQQISFGWCWSFGRFPGALKTDGWTQPSSDAHQAHRQLRGDDHRYTEDDSQPCGRATPQNPC